MKTHTDLGLVDRSWGWDLVSALYHQEEKQGWHPERLPVTADGLGQAILASGSIVLLIWEAELVRTAVR